MKHNEMFELIIMWWLLLLVWSFVYSCLDGKIGNQYKIVVSCTSTAVNWDENSQDSPSSSTEMSMLTTYCGKHVQNLCVCNWTTLKNPRRIGRGKATYSRRGAHSNYINNTWSLHRISSITFSIEYQNIRISEKEDDLHDVEVSDWKVMALYNYENKPNRYYHLLRLKFKLLLPLFFFFPFKLPRDTSALNHFGHLGLIYSKWIHV